LNITGSHKYFIFFINQVNIKLLSYGDEVPAAFYYYRSFFMCDFVVTQNRRLIIFLTYLIKVTIKKTNKEKNFKFIIPYFL